MGGGSRLKKARIIYNPKAGRETFKRDLSMVLEKLEIAGYEASAHATTREGDAKEAALQAVERKFDLIIAVGGDGTINEVVNGIAEQPYRPQVGKIGRASCRERVWSEGVGGAVDKDSG